MDLFQKLEELNILLTKALEEYKKRGKDYANCYKEYRVAVAKELLRFLVEKS